MCVWTRFLCGHRKRVFVCLYQEKRKKEMSERMGIMHKRYGAVTDAEQTLLNDSLGRQEGSVCDWVEVSVSFNFAATRCAFRFRQAREESEAGFLVHRCMKG